MQFYWFNWKFTKNSIA